MPKTKSPAPQQHHQLAIHTLVSIMPWDTVEKSAKFQANSATCSLLCLRVFCSSRVLLCRVAWICRFARVRVCVCVVLSCAVSRVVVSAVRLCSHAVVQPCISPASQHGSVCASQELASTWQQQQQQQHLLRSVASGLMVLDQDSLLATSHHRGSVPMMRSCKQPDLSLPIYVISCTTTCASRSMLHEHVCISISTCISDLQHYQF